MKIRISKISAFQKINFNIKSIFFTFSKESKQSLILVNFGARGVHSRELDLKNRVHLSPLAAFSFQGFSPIPVWNCS